MKANKGITMVALVITIVVMLIIASIGGTMGMQVIKNAKIQNLNTNMLLIQAKAKIISEKHSFDKNVELLGTTVDESMKSSLLEKELVEETDECKVWNQDTLDSQGLNDIKVENNTFIVNYTKNEIIYTPGYKMSDGRIYYTLSQIKTLVETE